MTPEERADALYVDDGPWHVNWEDLVAAFRQDAAEIERLRAALEKVRYKAGSHAVSESAMQRGEDDHSFAGIYAVANNALTK